MPRIYYKSFIWNNLKKLSNLTFSIILLLIIACLSIIGTIIEQDNTLDYYQNKYPIHSDKLFDFNWTIIERFELNQIYTNILFLTIIFLFGISLIVCTFSTQLPSLKNARRWKFKQIIVEHKQLYKQSYNKFHHTSSIIYYLNNIDYYVFYQKQYLYAYKGLHGRLAPVFVHVSLILLLIGSCVSLFTSFSLQEMIPTGETFNLQNTIKSGFFSKIPLHLTGSVETFDIEYYEDKSIRQFYSTITLTNNKTHKYQLQTISVNHPLYFEGLTIYQTDWQINGLNLEINNSKSIQIPVKKFTEMGNTYWLATFKEDQKTILSLLLSNLHGPITCYNQNGLLIDTLNLNEYKIIEHIPIKVNSILTSTGLQIKKDPGIHLIYISFGLLMLTSINSYISYTQIWVLLNNTELQISGLTNRAQINFEEDIFTLTKYILTS